MASPSVSGAIVSSCSLARPSRYAGRRGFSLIELMVAMLIGAIVVVGVSSVFLASQHIARTTHALADVQDSSRMAFELLARDIRNAGATGCGNRRVANVLAIGPDNGGVIWWGDWRRAILGFDGNDPDTPVGKAAGDRVAGKPSLQLLGSKDTSYSVASHDEARATLTLREASADLSTGEVFIVCDYDHAAIFKSSSVSGRTVMHAKGEGNCSAGLGYPASCESPNRYVFGPNAMLAPVYVSDWYLGINPDKGLSLYRLGLEGGTLKRQEMVRGVTDLQLAYQQRDHAGPFSRATEVTDWENVIAVRVTFTLQSADPRAGVNNAPISREFGMTATLRNRVQ
ncbi:MULTISPECIES: prepilin-type N-terminal cleavage/methylation domain-containing protein [unclassified Dyella]|uniref:prepilin-type N-terminal cleavage/methylation domain-containing protein n=1 Tax=unclassified Dyella TaxID=2634549 RepID=UPI001E5E8F3D|nr:MULTISPECIES: prepilin-type N-terminal cleavage/methylation domain-containing protein [unclassified Dyella]MDR3445820.1 prepilin-type N-terminal cleavage/methylation domain-containing protein [Dyella sp.]